MYKDLDSSILKGVELVNFLPTNPQRNCHMQASQFFLRYWTTEKKKKEQNILHKQVWGITYQSSWDDSFTGFVEILKKKLLLAVKFLKNDQASYPRLPSWRVDIRWGFVY